MVSRIEIILFWGILSVCSAVDIELSKEGPCLNPSPKSAKFDIEMYQDKNVKWYTPLLSKYELYRIAQDISGKEFEDITEKELKNSCILYQMESATSSCMTGLGGKSCFDMIPGEKDSFVWKVRGHEDWDGETWVTKAGNDYAVVVTCWSTGQRSFAVSSRQKVLPPSLKTEILQHLKSLGFNSSKYIYENNSEGCEDSDNKNTRDENEL